VEILLNSYQNVASVNATTYQKFDIENKQLPILEYNIRNALSATEIFDAEREANDVYRIYGRIEYLSLLNGLSSSYTELKNFFTPVKTQSKDIYNSFDFYLMKASDGYVDISGSGIQYVRYFEIIATPDNFELYNAGFSNNVYGEQVYAFNFNEDFNVATYADEFNFPATQLFLYARYKLGSTGTNVSETMFKTTWNPDNSSDKYKTQIYNQTLNIGDKIYGDLIEYSKSLFFQEQLSPQIYYITTPYSDNNTIKYLQWKYNPIIPFQLKYFSSSLNKANTGTTVYEQQISIPYYATSIENGNYVWRDILQQGYVDSETNLGVDYPFINKKRYLFSRIILDIIPNLDDANTYSVFAEINFDDPTTLDTTPSSDLNNIGKPCQ
jgi:hypothetical protein